MPTVLCASPALLAERGTPQHPDALVGYPCIGFDALAARSTWRFSRADAPGQFDVSIRPRLSVTTAAAAVLAAQQGVGAAQLYLYQCAEAMRQGTLRAILADFQPEPAPVSLLHAARGALPLKMRVFLDFAAGRLRGRLGEGESAVGQWTQQ